MKAPHEPLPGRPQGDSRPSQGAERLTAWANVGATDLIGQPSTAIDTPALVIDLDAMERNLTRMATFAREQQVKLRPHAKMHKSAELARLQMQAGAVGVCVQKTSEAEALAAGGVHDIYISNEVVAPHKLQRVAALAHALSARGGRLAIAVDSLHGVQALAQAFAGAPANLIDVFIELDVGQGRCGVAAPEAVLPLAQVIGQHAALRFAGLQAYQGKAQHLRTPQERRAALDIVLARVRQTCQLLQTAGIEVPLVTGAGTGTFSLEATSGVYGELQAGSYLFMDADYARNESDPAQPQFEHALFIKTQVMSVSATHAVCDAGHKSHAIDSGLPTVHGAALAYSNGGDEHGILHGDKLPAIGDALWLIPGHCDPTVNLHDQLIGVRGGLANGVVERLIRVDARGALS
jgi:D-serine deaminase-like pyridoxal phosphate-dependent protein